MMLRSSIITAALFVLSVTGCATTNQPDQTTTEPNQATTPVGTTQTDTATPTPQSTTPTGQNTVSTSDQQFVTQAAQANLTEIQLGQVAQEKAASSAIQQYGKQMVQDHTQASKELQQLANKKNITLPTDLDAQNQKVVKDLSQLSGTNFDRAYINQMVQDHEKSVSLFQNEAQKGQDPDFKAFAAKTLPTLQKHLEQARSLATKTTGSTNPPSTP